MTKKRLFIVFSAFALACSVWMLHEKAAANQEQTSAPYRQDIVEFVRQTFIHGVPYEQASKYDASVVPMLLRMLSDPKEESHWPNIVVTLGIIGEEKSSQSLINFLTVGEGRLSHSQYIAKSSVLMALGYLINKTGSERSLAYLKESLDPDVWARRNVRWVSPYHTTRAERDLQLSTMAVMGLALSGHSSARGWLLDLQKPATSEVAKKFRAAVADVVALALRDHEIIAKEGLLSYYRKSRTPSETPRPRYETTPIVSAPTDIITGREKPPQIITGRYAPLSVPGPAMQKPELPPPPASRTPLPVPEPYLQGPPPIKDGSRSIPPKN